jgi:tetratricopeptide (TPR) repeat protein
LGRRQIPWAVAPEAIGYSYPFLLALQATKGTLEVRNPETLSALQSISLPNANQMHVPNPYVSLAHAGKGFLVSSERCIWRMDALGYDAQIDALVEKQRLDEAISLLNMLEDALLTNKEGRLREIKMQKAQNLFDQKQYREALDLFTEVSAPPERVISLYPSVIAGDGISKTDFHLHEVNDQMSRQSSREPSILHEEAPTAQKESGSPKKKDPETSSIFSSPSRKRTSRGHVKSTSTGGPSFLGKMFGAQEETKGLEGKDLQAATFELEGYLASTRTKLQRFIYFDGSLKELDELSDSYSNLEELIIQAKETDERDRRQKLQDAAELVDTTLFRAYMLARPAMAGPLLRLPNFCNAEVVNEKLLALNRYTDLIDFFYGKKLHMEALELLQRFGQDKDDEKVPAQLKGPQRTVIYLQNLPPDKIDLVLQFAEWPLRADPEMGMDIFTTDTENAETLPRHRVLEFLEGIDKALAEKYLEHVIFELNDKSATFHQRLIEVYLAELNSDSHADEAAKSACNAKLLSFLKTSQYYETWKIIQLLPRDSPSLYEARAIVLGKMGEHRQALKIYVFDLHDPTKAEEYCNQVYLAESITSTPSSPTHSRRPSATTDTAEPSIYTILLGLYLSPPTPNEPQWSPALDILARHGSRLQATSTLALIPEVLPVQKLESYFRGRIRAGNTAVNEGRMIGGLRKSLDTKEEIKLRLGEERVAKGTGREGRNRYVVITEDRVCPVCHKRFGGSAVKVLPK